MALKTTSDKTKIRTLVVEDSTTVRRLLIDILNSDPAIEVIGEAANGVEAIKKALELSPDLITMDVTMPLVDGIDATKAIMRQKPTPILIVTAAAGSGNVELSLNAMNAGALMVVDKPVNPLNERFAQQSEQLLAMARAMAGVKVIRRWDDARDTTKSRRAGERKRIRIVVIGASAGGPAAVRTILSSIPREFPVPIVIVQHIARGFIDGLARWLGLNCILPVRVAKEGGELLPGHVYLAPDNFHLGFAASGHAQLSDEPPITGFRPSVDYLFKSASIVYGPEALGVILTGMGSDGKDGLVAMHATGSRILAQDKDTSIVYGMAQEAVRAGVVNDILALDDIAPRIVQLVNDDE